MKPLSILVTLLFATIEGYGQNLVPNPSFEDYINCPNTISEFEFCKDWYEFRPSCDYFNSCSSSTSVSVPFNWDGFSYQNAAFGNAYAGICAYASFPSEAREYIGCKLMDTLIKGQEYWIKFRANLSNNSSYAINCLGALFLTSRFDTFNWLNISNRAQVKSQNIIEDTLGWVTISGSFIADSSYVYLAIGNMFADSATSIKVLNTHGSQAYYYIEDVCVSTDSSTCNLSTEITSTVEDNTKIYPNPANDLLKIYLSKACDAVRLYDNLGRLAFEKFNVSDELEIDVSAFQPGVYIIETVRRDYLNTKKIIILK